MESLGFKNIDYAAISHTLGLTPKTPSDPFSSRKPPHDSFINSKIFPKVEPPLTSAELQDWQRLLVRVKLLQVGVHKVNRNLEGFRERCRDLKGRLDGEQKALWEMRIYGGLMDVKEAAEKLEERMERRAGERERKAREYGEIVKTGRERVDMIWRRGKGRADWWMERPWYEVGEE
ncbi:hypothetical protein TWF481_004852 [Arthrobotrys musiformis]|uniref:Uncharacterized protein n=1 Tax=Arthrobotrys musiformis TaxID=47236 RepID=A0AAV9WKW0_9PEZI